MLVQTQPQSSKPKPFALPRHTFSAAVLVLLAIIASELFLSTRQESQAFDESIHLFAGYEYWKHADFGTNPEHPPLVKLVAAMPLLPLQLKEPSIPPIPFFKAQNFIGASAFVYSADADSLLMRGRMAVALFALLLALLVTAAAYEMFGPHAALLALALLAFEPVLLANGALITTDMGLACCFFAAVYAFYRFAKRPTLARFALCTIAVSLTIVAKHSGLLILPVLVLLILVEMLRTRTEPPPSGGSERHSVLRQALAWAGTLLVIAVASYAILWAFYGFRYSARPPGLELAPPLAQYSAGLTNTTQKNIVNFLAEHRMFPEAYLYGWVDILQIPGTRPMFIFGKLYSTGHWFFFPAIFLIKTSLPLLILLVLAPFAKFRSHAREVLFLALPAIFFLAVSISSNLNLGVRHILSVYPFCIVLAAAAAWHFAQSSRPAGFAVAALVVFSAASSLHAFPDYLAYSNEAFGGPSNTYRLVTDANVDWGQSLKWVKTYIDKNHISDCWFAYVNPMVNPAYYGIPCKPLLSGLGAFLGGAFAPVTSPISGTILIGATEAAGALWGPGKLNPYEIFMNRTPDDLIENAVLVYHGAFDVPLLAARTRAATAMNLLRARRVPEAIEEAGQAAAQAPDSAQIQITLGQILLAANRPAEANKAFATARKLALSNYPDYQKGVIRMLDQPRPR